MPTWPTWPRRLSPRPSSTRLQANWRGPLPWERAPFACVWTGERDLACDPGISSCRESRPWATSRKGQEGTGLPAPHVLWVKRYRHVPFASEGASVWSAASILRHWQETPDVSALIRRLWPIGSADPCVCPVVRGKDPRLWQMAPDMSAYIGQLLPFWVWGLDALAQNSRCECAHRAPVATCCALIPDGPSVPAGIRAPPGFPCRSLGRKHSHRALVAMVPELMPCQLGGVTRQTTPAVRRRSRERVSARGGGRGDEWGGGTSAHHPGASPRPGGGDGSAPAPPGAPPRP